MAKWFDDEIDDKLRGAGNHVILIPARNPNASIDTVDIYDGITGKFIAANVPEKAATTFATVWNKLVDSNENNELIQKFNLEWILNSPDKYNSIINGK